MLCALTSVGRSTFAQPVGFIHLESEDGCVRTEVLGERVREALGDTIVPPDLIVEVVASEPVGFVVKRGASEIAARSFDELPPSCEGRLDALAVVIALSIEHALQRGDTDKSRDIGQGGVDARENDAGAAESGLEPETSAQPDETQGTASSAEAPGWGVRLSGQVSYLLGVLAVPVAGGRFSLDVLTKSQFTAGVGFLSTDRARIAFDIPRGATDEAFPQAESRLIAGEAHACFEPRFDGGAFTTCAGLAAGRVHSRGVGGLGAHAAGEAVPWLAGVLSGGARVPARGPFGMHLGADLFVNFLRPGVELEGAGSVTRPRDGAPIGGALNLSAFFVVE